MAKYELVCVIDAGLPSTEIKTLKSKIEQLVTIIETDDIGLLPTAYPIRGQDQAYYVSYLVEIDPATLDVIKQKMKLEEGLARYVFYTLDDSRKFLKYTDLKAQYIDLMTEEEIQEDTVESDEDQENNQEVS